VNRYFTALFSSTLACLSVLLAACGSSNNAPAPQATAPTAPIVPQAVPPIAAKADLIITVDGTQHACLVALKSESQGSSIPCNDLIPFLRDELRVPSGAVYDLRTAPTLDPAEALKLRANLKNAGYRFVGEQS
jgi:hypothetical protein